MRICLWLALVFLAAGCRQSVPARDAHLQSPSELADAAKSRKLTKIFVNPRAHEFLTKEKLKLAPANPQDTAALTSPSLWRKLDRAQRFDAVLLAGPAAEIAPLLNHLANSPDFKPVHLDNWGALFVRGVPAAYQVPDVSDVAKVISSKEDRAIYLAQMALMLDAVDDPKAAKEYLSAALDIAPDEATVHICAAAQALNRKHYPDAIKHADRAYELHPKDLTAMEIEARALSAGGAKDAAWQVATKIKSMAPDDMNLLFLHAQLASAAHAYAAEQDSLEHLIDLAEKAKISPTDYRVYLGQCFAHQGLARPALLQLELALKDPTITAQRRADLTTAMETVRTQAGDLAQ